MKTCSKCKTSKPFSDFYPRYDRPNRYQSWCKECKNRSKKTPEERKKHKERNKRYLDNLTDEQKIARSKTAAQWHKDNRQRSRELKRQSYKRRLKADPRLPLRRILKKKYNLAIEDYDQMVIDQNNKCYIRNRS